jgi:hypothetical protein
MIINVEEGKFSHKLEDIFEELEVLQIFRFVPHLVQLTLGLSVVKH